MEAVDLSRLCLVTEASPRVHSKQPSAAGLHAVTNFPLYIGASSSKATPPVPLSRTADAVRQLQALSAPRSQSRPRKLT